jgi:hypothetical protein
MGRSLDAVSFACRVVIAGPSRLQSREDFQTLRLLDAFDPAPRRPGRSAEYKDVRDDDRRGLHQHTVDNPHHRTRDLHWATDYGLRAGLCALLLTFLETVDAVESGVC